jgi:low temperature requirement protein LtrA
MILNMLATGSQLLLKTKFVGNNSVTHHFATINFIVLFNPVWFTWVGATFFATKFGSDDLAHRIFILLQMMGAAAVMAVTRTYSKSRFNIRQAY